jgi:hypothetical protein
MSETLFLVAVILLGLLLLGVGLFFALQQRTEGDEPPLPRQFNSGVFSVVRTSPRESLLSRKPNEATLRDWLSQQVPPLNPERIQALLDQWHDVLEASIAAVERGDRDGRDTYRFDVPESERPLVPALEPDTYITREAIYNNPELLPPYYPGCAVRLIRKEADSEMLGTPSRAGWKPLMPQNGKYPLPDWRTLPNQLD